ncbi:NAD(P)/FAD-dependent oxidoreductase [Pseudidiomarina insulisalsae]|uniref:FAD-dependent oxidoreductase n=1 Tax=Pseudidiomarina insulisalsae TaxID=575789 RepID=A0A432YCS2_9GAMM|nr:NAD(P)/FAD-dependent oxidoreductase [Pseudidiomarina insulisalsae]RUO58733.1 FAD-dependent oxidoreductase [Pseudidiomarina insulisalsae]
MSKNEKQELVVVGGGAGGLELVTKLARKFRTNVNVNVTLVDRNLTHIWKPLLHEVAAGALDSDVDGVDYRVQAADAGFRFQPGELIDVDAEQRCIRLAAIRDDVGDEVVAERTLNYTTLILAIGSVTNDFGIKGASEYCYFLDSVQQARRFHHTLMNTFLALQARKYSQPLKVAIVGAGATGVELSAELHKSAELIRSYGFDDFEMNHLQITLIELADRILPALPERIADSARDELESLGVKVRTGTPVTEATEKGFLMEDGELIEAPIKVWAAGVKAPPFLSKLKGLETNKGNQILARRTLQSSTHDSIFVMGDCAAVEQPDGSRVPPRAQAAHQMANHLYKAMLRQQKGRPLLNFKYRDHGSLISLSSYSAVGNLMGNLTKGSMKVEGFLARIIYKGLYRQHQVAVHGYFKTFLLMLGHVISRGLRPRLKLH